MNMHVVDHTGHRGAISYILDVGSPYGRFILRTISVGFFVLIFLVLIGLLITNLVFCLDRTTGLVQRDNIGVHFITWLGFVGCEFTVFHLVNNFFAEDRIDLSQIPQEERECERSYRSYIIVNIACLLAFLSYLVFVLGEKYKEAYVAVFSASILFMFSHLLLIGRLQEYSKLQKFEKYPYTYIYVTLVSFFGIITLLVMTLLLADQQ